MKIKPVTDASGQVLPNLGVETRCDALGLLCKVK